MAKRNAQGAGSIRQRKDGRWEARYTTGRNPATGKQTQRSVYGDTQKEVLKKLQQINVELEKGSYVEPSKMKLSEWLDIWVEEYTTSVKRTTYVSYKSISSIHITPALGNVELQKLNAHQVQTFYNKLLSDGLSAKTIKNVHGVLHGALKQAVALGYTLRNVTENCTLPRIERKEMTVLSKAEIGQFLNAISGHRYESLFFTTLFTGMRMGEVLGLQWSCIDFNKGVITIDKQLTRDREQSGVYKLVAPKNDKVRHIKPAPDVMEKLRAAKIKQLETQLQAGKMWDNSLNLVFTTDTGRYTNEYTLRDSFKAVIKPLGIDIRFHDLRHSYAVVSIMSGENIKTLQQNIGHHSAAFTLDTYAHVTPDMMDDSSKLMQGFIDNIEKI